MINSTKYLIVGNGAAGHFAAQEIRKNDKDGKLTIISKEPTRTYIRTLLAKCILEPLPDEKLFLAKKEWYEKNNIKQILDKEIVSIDEKTKTVLLDSDETISFEKLIIASGSYNFIPPLVCDGIQGSKKIDSFNYNKIKGLHTIRKLEDTRVLASDIKSSKKAVVVGGGLLGLEAAGELLKLGLNVTVVEFFDRLLPRQLDRESSEILKNIAEKSGINLILNDSATDIITKEDSSGNEIVDKVKLNSNEEISADIVVFSIGIRPNTSLIEKTSIKKDKGIIVDKYMQTSSKDIYACGDVAEINGFIYGTWPAAMTMGRVAGSNASGESLEFQNLVLQTTFDSLNAKIFSAGNIDFEDSSLDFYSSGNKDKGISKKLFFKDNRLIAGILIGDTTKSTRVVKGIENGISKAEMLENDIL